LSSFLGSSGWQLREKPEIIGRGQGRLQAFDGADMLDLLGNCVHRSDGVWHDLFSL